jgi:hypothetical protein
MPRNNKDFSQGRQHGPIESWEAAQDAHDQAVLDVHENGKENK